MKQDIRDAYENLVMEGNDGIFSVLTAIYDESAICSPFHYRILTLAVRTIGSSHKHLPSVVD